MSIKVKLKSSKKPIITKVKTKVKAKAKNSKRGTTKGKHFKKKWSRKPLSGKTMKKSIRATVATLIKKKYSNPKIIEFLTKEFPNRKNRETWGRVVYILRSTFKAEGLPGEGTAKKTATKSRSK